MIKFITQVVHVALRCRMLDGAASISSENNSIWWTVGDSNPSGAGFQSPALTPCIVKDCRGIVDNSFERSPLNSAPHQHQPRPLPGLMCLSGRTDHDEPITSAASTSINACKTRALHDHPKSAGSEPKTSTLLSCRNSTVFCDDFGGTSTPSHVSKYKSKFARYTRHPINSNAARLGCRCVRYRTYVTRRHRCIPLRSSN